MREKLILCLAIPFLIAGCSVKGNATPKDGDDNPSNPSDPTPSGEDEKEVTPNFTETDQDYLDFFNHGNNVEVKVRINNDVAKKANDYGKRGSWLKQEMYHPCDVTITINGQQRFYAEESGIRLKGNLSKERDPDFVDDNGNINYNAHFKLHFGQTFDDAEDNDYYTHNWTDATEREARDKRKFGGMKKIDLKWNRNNDATFTKEAYAKYCYRQVGVVAQNINLVKFTLETENDSKTYIYQAIETLDSQSMKRYYGKNGGKGNLYKGLYARASLTTSSISGNNLNPESVNNTNPSYPLKTNEKENDHTLFKEVVRVLNTKSDTATFVNSFKNIAEIDSILRYLAMSWVIGNPDDLKNNSNNTYFYFNSINDNFSIIPYDDDRCFGILDGWEVDMSTLPADSTRMAGKSAGGGKVWCENPLIWRLTISENDSGQNYSDKWPMVQEYHDRYMQYAQQYMNQFLDASKFQEFTNEFYYAPSKNISDAGSNNQTFAEYATSKKANLSKN